MLPSSIKVLRSAGYYVSSKFPTFSFMWNQILEKYIEEYSEEWE